MAAAAVALPPVEEIRADSYVGFDTITQQIEHKLLKRGFQFNIIVVGTCLFSGPKRGPLSRIRLTMTAIQARLVLESLRS